ncbi:hypothetical protein [Ferrimicrobium sp.]|uniref:hypothetical protein n=1 Tax=Ferrimicrobium sp. TaxID=2926050 RepID=UPI00261E1FAB|nr:hypothetical protein [Ferrimicrobium sp.]
MDAQAPPTDHRWAPRPTLVTTIDELDQHARPHHGNTATAREKRQAASALRTQCTLTEVEWLVAHPSPNARELAAQLAPDLATAHLAVVMALLRRLADDENWEVREWAAEGIATALDGFVAETRRFELTKLLGDTNPCILRAGIVASGYLAARLTCEEARPILALLFDHDREPDRYVRKNLFPFAIGSYFVPAHPECAIATVKERLSTADPSQIASWQLILKAKAAQSLPELRVLLDSAKQH